MEEHATAVSNTLVSDMQQVHKAETMLLGYIEILRREYIR
jgi:hypothetical protein